MHRNSVNLPTSGGYKHGGVNVTSQIVTNNPWGAGVEATEKMLVSGYIFFQASTAKLIIPMIRKPYHKTSIIL